MMQIQLGPVAVLVLEPMNVEYLKQGRFLRVDMSLFQGSPLQELVIDWTPDLEYCQAKIMELIAADGPANIKPSQLQAIIHESQTRPEVKQRPNHDGVIDVVKFATAKGPTN